MAETITLKRCDGDDIVFTGELLVTTLYAAAAQAATGTAPQSELALYRADSGQLIAQRTLRCATDKVLRREVFLCDPRYTRIHRSPLAATAA